MQITATLVNLYHVCKRELWLHAHGIRMEHTSQTVAEGKLIHETSYSDRAARFTEIEIEGCKIDFYDARNKVVHETKKSDAMENAYEWQVKYYIYLLSKIGVEDAIGLLEYPKLKQTKKVTLEPEDKDYIVALLPEIEKIIQQPCPPKINAKICKSCSYYEFCYVDQ